MAKPTIAALPLSSNDISSLAQIFHVVLQHYCTVVNPFEKDYLSELSSLVGLGFTAILADGSLLCVYERYLQTFIRYRSFKEHPEHLQMFARAIAEIASGAVQIFRYLKYPSYYDEFIRLIHKTVDHIWIPAEKVAESRRLMQLLTQKRTTGLL